MATEILRPSASGDECNINTEVGCSACPNHYDCVDEAEADDITTYVKGWAADPWVRDLYNVADHSEGVGTINHIKVYARCRTSTPTGTHGNLMIAIKSGEGAGAPDTVDESSEITVPTNAWAPFSNQWDINPKTEGAFTWDEIDKLQIGLSIRCAQPGPVGGIYCTQVYVEVDYTPITEKTSSDTGSGVDAKATGNPLATLVKAETGSGVEALVSHLVTLIRADTGSGVGASALLATLVRADVGQGVDVILSRALEAFETGQGVDVVVALLATLVRADVGQGVDIILSRALEAFEIGQGVDAVVAFVRPSSIMGRKTAYDGYRCFMEQYVKNRVGGRLPLKLPDGTLW